MRLKHIGMAVSLLAALFLAPVASVAAVNTQTSVPPNITFQTVVSGLTEPVLATHAGDGSGRIFIVQQTGEILILKGTTLNASPFLDVSGLITNPAGGEQGLLGLAFDPNYSTNGYFYITYTNRTAVGNDVLARYHVSSGDPDVADASSAQIMLTATEPEANHNGGMIAFGPDGYLYFGLGDGGGGGDNHGSIGNGQDKTTLLGKILRLDVSTVPATAPATNPFYGAPPAMPEIWAYGVRNPWRFSFDKVTGDLYIGDVGQDTEEEIDFQPAGFAGGANYGWRIREGNLCYNPSTGCVSPSGYVAPVSVYDHGSGDSIGCAVTGGYVYRGSLFPGLVGVYLYGDFCTGNLWGLYKNASNQWVRTLIKNTDYSISGFGEDEAGELYILDYGSGSLIHIVQAPVTPITFTSLPSQDGYVVETSEKSGVGGAVNNNRGYVTVGDNQLKRQYRSILSFSTGQLPNSAVITSATLSIKLTGIIGSDPFASLGNLVVDIGKPAFGSSLALVSSDFQAPGYLARAVFSSPPVSGWYSTSLSAADLARISLITNTQFRLRFSKDDNNNHVIDRANFASGNAALDRPQLLINYFLP